MRKQRGINSIRPQKHRKQHAHAPERILLCNTKRCTLRRVLACYLRQLGLQS